MISLAYRYNFNVRELLRPMRRVFTSCVCVCACASLIDHCNNIFTINTITVNVNDGVLISPDENPDIIPVEKNKRVPLHIYYDDNRFV